MTRGVTTTGRIAQEMVPYRAGCLSLTVQTPTAATLYPYHPSPKGVRLTCFRGLPLTPARSELTMSGILIAIARRLRDFVGGIPCAPLTILLACAIGVLGGYGAICFSFLIDFCTEMTTLPAVHLATAEPGGVLVLIVLPAVGLLCVAWLTQRWAPEAKGHGVPEVITAVARKDGVIRPRVALVKIFASGLCIGTGGSVGREGPIVQIGASLGSLAGQMFHLSPRHVKVLVAAGAAAGISATFNAPIAGVIFASEIILGSFAVESLTPIVVASVLADVVQKHNGEHGQHPAFTQLAYQYEGAILQLPTYVLLGLLCGVLAIAFSKLLYAVEELSHHHLPCWWHRALACGLLVGLAGALYANHPPVRKKPHDSSITAPVLFGVGYHAVDHALHLEISGDSGDGTPPVPDGVSAPRSQAVRLHADDLLLEFWWLLPLAFLKPLTTSITLAGGGSGGIFAPSLFMGATLGGAFGLACQILVPAASASPGVYAIVGMGAVVAGTTHGVLSAILIVYEMTGNYYLILPIMTAAGLASFIARAIDHESIYYKKLSRRGESIARGHDLTHLEHVMVRDVMIEHFPTVRYNDTADAIVRVARANSHIETLPVMDDNNRLVGIIRAEDVHRVLDTDVAAHLITAEDISVPPPAAVSPDTNLLEALREFGSRDVETLPVETSTTGAARLVGLLLRNDVMRRYRWELLHH